MNKLLILAILLISVSCFAAAPVISALTLNDTTPNVGDIVKINATFTDADGNFSYKFLVCKSDAVNSTTASCGTAGEWCSYPTTPIKYIEQGKPDSGSDSLYGNTAYDVAQKFKLPANVTSVDRIGFSLYKKLGVITTPVIVEIFAWNTNYTTTVAGAVLGNTSIPSSVITGTTWYSWVYMDMDYPARNLTSGADYLLRIRTIGGDASNAYGIGHGWINGGTYYINDTYHIFRRNGSAADSWTDLAFRVYQTYESNKDTKNCNFTVTSDELGLNYYYGYICRNYGYQCSVFQTGNFTVTCPYSLFTFDVLHPTNKQD